MERGIRVVAFTTGMAADEHRALAESVAAEFTEWPGLHVTAEARVTS